MQTTFTCDLSSAPEPLPHFWEHTIGSCHATLALRADWQAQLRRCATELGIRHVRFHGLLSDDMGTLMCECDQLLYSFFNADQIFDFLLSIGVRPFVELSFMPSALSSGGQIVFHYRGNVTPPRDYGQWSQLIRKLVQHWIERYGATEVRQWFFEVWNEPNLHDFWSGTQDDYFNLYRHTAQTIKSIDPQLRVGGPATANNAWITQFCAFCADNGVPADFISTHHYPTDAFGRPGDDTETQLALCPRGVLHEQAAQARREAGARPLYYTEWSSSSNARDPLHDESFAACFILKTIMEANGLVQGYSYWTFSDIFEENYFPSVPFHGGFGLLNLHGIPKPSYRVFEILHGIGEQLYAVAGAHATVDTWVVRGARGITLLLSNFALPRHAIAAQTVTVALLHTQRPGSAQIRSIDATQANPKAAWLAMGSPEYLNQDTLARLMSASRLVPAPQSLDYRHGRLQLTLTLAPQSVTAISLCHDPATA